jgi:hypothetical protein
VAAAQAFTTVLPAQWAVHTASLAATLDMDTLAAMLDTVSQAVVQATASQVAAVADSTAVEAEASTVVVAADTAKNYSARKETAGILPAVFFLHQSPALLPVEKTGCPTSRF